MLNTPNSLLTLRSMNYCETGCSVPIAPGKVSSHGERCNRCMLSMVSYVVSFLFWNLLHSLMLGLNLAPRAANYRFRENSRSSKDWERPRKPPKTSSANQRARLGTPAARTTYQYSAFRGWKKEYANLKIEHKVCEFCNSVGCCTNGLILAHTIRRTADDLDQMAKILTTNNISIFTVI